MRRLGFVAMIAAVAVLCLLVTTSASALALKHSRAGYLSRDTASSLFANYSADAAGSLIAPLSNEISRAAEQDEAALVQAKPEVTRLEPVRIEPATPEAQAVAQATPVPTATVLP